MGPDGPEPTSKFFKLYPKVESSSQRSHNIRQQKYKRKRTSGRQGRGHSAPDDLPGHEGPKNLDKDLSYVRLQGQYQWTHKKQKPEKDMSPAQASGPKNLAKTWMFQAPGVMAPKNYGAIRF